MINWKEQIKFVEFNCYCGEEPNTLEERMELLKDEKEWWDWLKEQENFWKEAEECDDCEEVSELIEKGTGYLVDRIILNDDTDYNECSMFWAWKQMSNEMNDDWGDYAKAKLIGSTYSLRDNVYWS